MSAPPSPTAVIKELRAQAELHALSERIAQSALEAAQERRQKLNLTADPEQAQIATPWGRPCEIIERGPASAEEWLLIGALAALGVEKQLPSAPEAELELAARWVWLAAHTGYNPFVAADAALGEKANVVWQAVARIAEKPELGGAEFGPGESLVAAAALHSSSSEVAQKGASELSRRTTDPLLSSVLRAPAQEQKATTGTATTLRGELSPAPRGPVTTALLAATLILFALQLGRLVLRFAFGYRRPAELKLSERGLELEHRTELLGRVLRERSTLIPLSNLARVTREVKFTRAGLYAGLFALVLGSYFGMGLLVDGCRVPGGSFPLFGLGVLLIALGLVIDFVLSTVADSARGRCKLVIVPRTGRALCVAALDPQRADLLLELLAEKLKAPAKAAETTPD